MSARIIRLVAPSLLLLASCRFQDLTPGSSRHDEATLQALVGSFYQAIGDHNLVLLERVALPAATALISPDPGPTVLVPMRTIIDVPERRNQNGGARVVRADLHPDGNVASDRVVVVTHSRDGHWEYEASDMLTLARRGGGWQVAHAEFGPWRSRSAP